ncbi:signal peptidase I [Tessaracoccus aquimaris]|uniref:Signal peptidase I n=1 Tax=Tessaracoccus aquimaris TaxID=1332264 RepID=A0A1Q2CKH2_9ACTN|nr:signal peptidase I [Tessaracoccus aquimaris]AQP46603.1 signal peptidase I [Tessaracoccus aquimaris]
MARTRPARAAGPVPAPGIGRLLAGWGFEAIVVAVGALVVAVLLRTFVAQLFIIPSVSMENTLKVDDRVVVSKFGGFTRGDVVVFVDPGGWLPEKPRTTDPLRLTLEFVGVLPDSSNEHLIKRVIGMPGDHVRRGDDGRIEVNGTPLDEGGYLYENDGVRVAPARVAFDVVVPAGHIFVMGDHRDNSDDSRCKLGRDDPQAAFVPVDLVVGAAVAIVTPFDRMTTFRVPDTFADVPAPTAAAPAVGELLHPEPGC